MPSDLALALIDLVSDRRAFPDEAARDLMRLLGHTVAAPDLSATRWDLLGPLVTLINRSGKLPTVREYDAFRAAERPGAPAGSTLTERYGTWFSALKYASNFMHLSLSNPVRPHGKHHHEPYTPAECLAAIAQFHKRFGEWPHPAEYREWSRSARRVARERGARDPVLPDLKVILRRFGTFDRASQAAKEIYGEPR